MPVSLWHHLSAQPYFGLFMTLIFMIQILTLLYTIHSAIDQNHGLELTIFKIELKPQNDNYLQNDNLTPLKLNM